MPSNLFKWDDNFNTGNKVVDKQHYKLVKLINNLMELSIENVSVSEKDLQSISKQLSEYVNVHFETEEALMKAYSIDERHAKEHIESHSDFVREVSLAFKDKKRLTNANELNIFIEYLIRWLAYHILNTDKILIRQINHIKDLGMNQKEAYEKEEKIIESNTEPLLKALRVLYLLVSKKNKEIRKKNIELEEKVKERTEELMQANEKMSEIIFEDVLTKLPNRRFVMKELQKLFYNWERYGQIFSILFIDLDKFKLVNDTFGHEVGDEVLIWVAELLKSNIRETDIACRLGGDEFIVICPHTDKDGAHAIESKLIKYSHENQNDILKYWKPSMSIGVAAIHSGIKTSSEILKEADAAMYKIKLNRKK